MAKTDLNTIKNWFKNGLKPTQEQFWAWLDSFWHKDDKIPAENIQGLNDMLSNIDLSSKVENTDFESYKQEQVEALNQKVDKEEGKGLSANDFTEELKNKLENFSNLSTEDQTIASGVERTLNVEGRLKISGDGVEEKEVSDPQFTHLLTSDEDGTIATINCANWQKHTLTAPNGYSINVDSISSVKELKSVGSYFSNGSRKDRPALTTYNTWGETIIGRAADLNGRRDALVSFFYNFQDYPRLTLRSVRFDGSIYDDKVWMESDNVTHYTIGSNIVFDRNRRYGDWNSALSKVTFTLPAGKRGGVTVWIFFNGTELPKATEIKWQNENDFRSNESCLLKLEVVDTKVIIGTIVKI
ncbi:hypothetical protein EDL99_09810 [Ornithobacterium rhinotracheale]|uniref:hypothetical protein n=1 Tax=Ornithobacterium rhinotracheale TaxID=28251 RepID=UPI00129C2BA5|nr:hypothetical protein [Ornithobacterium rhinotracheale]MRJ09151.1 hypothetical protein [Ornithobacterium rhinotracheale]UOH77264.1 hypothetical protein MT996_08580 [Ornithobacterium rhinotracheale]